MLSIELRDEDDHWYQSRRVNDLRRAYTIGRRATPDEVRRVTGYAISELLAGILPALLDVCLVQAAATTLGAVVGGALGSLAGGVGAVPGAIEGAATGFGLSATILGWLGLTFLFVAVGQNLGEVAGRLSVAVRLAWDASDYPPEQRHEHVRRAGHILAEAMALLMLMILQAIVAWLLKKGLDKLPELVAELRSSKLGQGFAEWVEKNAAKLYDDPRLRPKRAGSTTKEAAESEAQSPSQLAGKRTTEAAIPAEKSLPPLRQQYVDEVSNLKSKAEAMKSEGASSEQIARTLHADRRALGEKYKALTPPDKLAEIYERNIQKYGDKLGPTVDWLRDKGKTWEQIIESATRTGGKDLGF